MEHLHITQTDVFIKVYTDKGYYVTKYTDGDTIKFYTASTLMYCPLNADLSVYRVITEEQHKEYLELKEMSLKPKHIE